MYAGDMKHCEGFPTIVCLHGGAAVYDMLGYQLCEKCADNWRQAPTREDEHAGAQIVALRGQLAALAAERDELLIRLAEYRMVNTLATDALERYGARFGPLS